MPMVTGRFAYDTSPNKQTLEHFSMKQFWRNVLLKNKLMVSFFDVFYRKSHKLKVSSSIVTTEDINFYDES